MVLAAAIVGLFVLPDPWRIVFLFCAALIEIGEVYFWIRFLRRYRVTTGAEGLIGERAEVIEALSPAGRVRLRGEIWNARGPVGTDRGEPVRVASLDGLTLVVEPFEEASGRLR
jgi:membrane protein implicated in regulation of membrane protease activity